MKRRRPFLSSTVLCLLALSYLVASCIFFWLPARATQKKHRTLERYASIEKNVHIALIFDTNRMAYATQVVRSASFHADEKTRLHFHLVAPRELQNSSAFSSLAAQYALNIYFYDYGACQVHTVLFQAWSDPRVHTSAHCKLHLSSIMPEALERVLYLDTDVTVVDDLAPCFFAPLSDTEYIGMVADMGEVCQLYPDECWPLGIQHRIPEGTVCGSDPNQRAAVNANEALCPRPGDSEPFQLNGGVILMDLAKMRRQKFVERLAEVVIRTARLAHFKVPRWGEQDHINSFFRIHPETLRLLPCGCNYQYSALRRELHCPKLQTVYVAHGWYEYQGLGRWLTQRAFLACCSHVDPSHILYAFRSSAVGNRQSRETYTRHFQHFLNDQNDGPNPSPIPLLSNHRLSGRNVPGKPHVERVPECPHQHWKCSLTEYESGAVFTDASMYVLVATSTKRTRTQEVAAPRGLPASPKYLLYCEDSGVSERGIPDSDTDLRCPMSAVLETITPIPLRCLWDLIKDEWVLVLNKGVTFSDSHAVVRLLARSTSIDEVIVVHSDELVTMGFMAHSSNLQAVDQEVRGTYQRLLSALMSTSGRIHEVSDPHGSLLSHPSEDGVTVIITSHAVEGLRHTWLQRTVREYRRPRYRQLVSRIIVVWNNPHRPPPPLPADVVVLHMEVNSLNNRWVHSARHVQTEAVLILDDDIMITSRGISCLLSHWKRDRSKIIGPFVRVLSRDGYALDERTSLASGTQYSMVLPRVLLAHRRLLDAYTHKVPPHVKEYVDIHEGHCDDVALNAAALSDGSFSLLRVIPPGGTIVDYFDQCYRGQGNKVGGLALQGNRRALRTECSQWIISHFRHNATSEGLLNHHSLVEYCSYESVHAVARRHVLQAAFESMHRVFDCEVEK